jgi:hypothetical protein
MDEIEHAYAEAGPDLRAVLNSAARLQELVPDAVLVGGSAAALYAGVAVPASVHGMLSGDPVLPAFATVLGHAHELLFGFALPSIRTMSVPMLNVCPIRQIPNISWRRPGGSSWSPC